MDLSRVENSDPEDSQQSQSPLTDLRHLKKLREINMQDLPDHPEKEMDNNNALKHVAGAGKENDDSDDDAVNLIPDSQYEADTQILSQESQELPVIGTPAEDLPTDIYTGKTQISTGKTQSLQLQLSHSQGAAGESVDVVMDSMEEKMSDTAGETTDAEQARDEEPVDQPADIRPVADVLLETSCASNPDEAELLASYLDSKMLDRVVQSIQILDHVISGGPEVHTEAKSASKSDDAARSQRDGGTPTFTDGLPAKAAAVTSESDKSAYLTANEDTLELEENFTTVRDKQDGPPAGRATPGGSDRGAKEKTPAGKGGARTRTPAKSTPAGRRGTRRNASKSKEAEPSVSSNTDAKNDSSVTVTMETDDNEAQQAETIAPPLQTAAAGDGVEDESTQEDPYEFKASPVKQAPGKRSSRRKLNDEKLTPGSTFVTPSNVRRREEPVTSSSSDPDGGARGRRPLRSSSGQGRRRTRESGFSSSDSDRRVSAMRPGARQERTTTETLIHKQVITTVEQLEDGQVFSFDTSNVWYLESTDRTQQVVDLSDWSVPTGSSSSGNLADISSGPPTSSSSAPTSSGPLTGSSGDHFVDSGCTPLSSRSRAGPLKSSPTETGKGSRPRGRSSVASEAPFHRTDVSMEVGRQGDRARSMPAPGTPGLEEVESPDVTLPPSVSAQASPEDAALLPPLRAAGQPDRDEGVFRRPLPRTYSKLSAVTSPGETTPTGSRKRARDADAEAPRAKRVRSEEDPQELMSPEISMVGRSAHVAPYTPGTPVFAKWKQDDNFYPGCIKKREKSGKLCVHFADGDVSTVAPHEMLEERHLAVDHPVGVMPAGEDEPTDGKVTEVIREGEDTQYVVRTTEGDEHTVPASQLILSAAQVKSIRGDAPDEAESIAAASPASVASATSTAASSSTVSAASVSTVRAATPSSAAKRKGRKKKELPEEEGAVTEPIFAYWYHDKKWYPAHLRGGAADKTGKYMVYFEPKNDRQKIPEKFLMRNTTLLPKGSEVMAKHEQHEHWQVAAVMDHVTSAAGVHEYLLEFQKDSLTRRVPRHAVVMTSAQHKAMTESGDVSMITDNPASADRPATPAAKKTPARKAAAEAAPKDDGAVAGPSGVTTPRRRPQPASPTTPQYMPVMAPWSDGHFYPGVVVGQPDTAGKVKVKFDDGSQGKVLARDVVVTNIEPDMMVFAQRGDEGDEYQLAKVRAAKDIDGDVSYDVVFAIGDVEASVPRSSLMLKKSQVLELDESSFLSSQGPTDSPMARLSMSNVLEGKRQRKPMSPALSPAFLSPASTSKDKRGRKQVPQSPLRPTPVLTGDKGPIPPQGSTLFQNYIVLFTMGDPRMPESDTDSQASSVTDQCEYDGDYLTEQVVAGGGTVMSKPQDVLNNKEKQVLVVSNRYQRTMKYLYALAACIPTVNYLWIRDCCRQNEALSITAYTLPAGRSLMTGKICERSNKKPLNGLCFYVDDFNKDFHRHYRRVVTLSNAALSDVIDGSVYAVLAREEDSLSEATRLALQQNPDLRVLNSEWVVQSFITGIRQPTDHERYLYDDDK